MSTSDYSRRKFLHNSAMSIMAASLSVPLWGNCAKKSKDKLGIALVGLGNYATGQLAPALQETEHCYLAGIVTGTPEKENVWQEKYGIPASNIYNYANYDQIADNGDIDIIYVVLPNAMHAEYTIRAARAGKHVICEKPMAISVAECQSMIDTCDTAGVKLSIGYRLHFEPHTQEIKRIGQEKVLGPMKYMNTEFGFRLRNADQWRLDKSLAGGGSLVDVGIYAIQAARYSTGLEPIAVSAKEIKTDREMFSEVDETMMWHLEFENGIVANSASSYASRMERLYGATTNGWFELRPAYSYGGIQGETSKMQLDYPQVNQQARQMDAFAIDVLHDRASIVSGEEGLQDMRIIEAIYTSAREGSRRVTL